MKNILAIIGLCMVAVIGVNAQQYETTTVTITNLVAAVTTNTINASGFTATKNGEVVVTVAGQLSAAGTTGTKFTFARGISSSSYAGDQFNMTLTQTGTISASLSTNISMGAFGYLRIASIGNGDDDGVFTNATVSYTVKPDRKDGK